MKKTLLWLVAPLVVAGIAVAAGHPLLLPGPGYIDDQGNAGSITSTGTITAEHLVSTDDLVVTDALTCASATASGTVQAEQLTSTDDLNVTGTCTCGDASLGGALNLSGNDLTNLDDVYSAAQTSDAAGRVTVISTQGPIVQAAQPTNDDGGNLVLAPTSAWKGITGVTRASVSEGATVTLTAQSDGVVLAACVKTEGDGTAGTFECNGAGSDADCVTNLKATYTATPCTGVTVSTVAGETMGFAATPGSASRLTLAVSDTDIAIASGTDGAVVFPGGTAAAPGLRFAEEATGFFRKSSTQVGIVIAGTERGYLSSAGIYSDSHFIAGATGQIYWSTRGYLDSPIASARYVRVSGSGSTAGAWMSYPQTVSCDADCDSPVTVTSNVVIVNCTDAGGCALGLAETNWSATASGVVTLVAGTTQTGALTLADSAGVTELAGGTNWTPTAGDTLQLVYNPSALTWAEVSRADVTP